MNRKTAGRTQPLTWRNGGWLLTLLAVSAVVFTAWQMIPILREHGHRAVGDLKTVASYGFDLSECLIPCADIVPAAMPKDGIRVLRLPGAIRAAGVDSLGRAWHARYLVDSDRVIGIVVNGVARAYPVRVLCWHEVANDTLGGLPIAVAYNPLCDSAAAFERASPGDTLDFGVSGLLWNSSQLLYDRRRDPRGESLWSVLQERAVAGPAAADERRLAALPVAVVRWDHWLARHPGTTVLRPDKRYSEQYRSDPWRLYWTSAKLRFPVEPLPPAPRSDADLAFKDPVLAVTAGAKTVAYPLRAVAARVAASEGGGAAAGKSELPGYGIWQTTQGGVHLRFEYGEEPPTLAVTAPDAVPITDVQAFWFAWYSQHPDGEVVWP